MRGSRAAPVWRLLALVIVAGVPPPDAVAQPKPEKVEWVFIDGEKNPELIPEWSAWETLFSTIAGGRKLLPSNVHFVVSREEAELILRESEASVKRTEECNARIMALKPLVGKQKLSTIIERQKVIRLDCRWANLHARDRLLAALNPAAAAELTVFAEHQKKTTTFTVAKSEVAFLRLPQ